MSFGYGMVHCKYSKKEINTKSSAGAKIVGVSDYLQYKIWVYLFIGSQGYDIKQKILFQYNQSAIKMKKNGNKSATGKSRHIDIRYFFANDMFESKISPFHTVA